MKSLHHTFDVHLAQEFSVNEAILIHHFQHWIEHNRRLQKNFHEERWWMFQTIEEIAANFCYLTPKQVEKTVNKLVKKKILRKGNFNKVKFDRTLWYSFEDEERFLPISSGISPKREIRFPQKGEPIPNTKKDSSSNSSNQESHDPGAAGRGSKEPPSAAEREELQKRLKNRKGEKIKNLPKWEEKVLQDIRSKPPKKESAYETNRKMLQEFFKEVKAHPENFRGEISEMVEQGVFVGLKNRLSKDLGATVSLDMSPLEVFETLEKWKK